MSQCQYFHFKHNQIVISTEKVMDYFDARLHLATSEPSYGCFTVVVCSGLELDSLSHKAHTLHRNAGQSELTLYAERY